MAGCRIDHLTATAPTLEAGAAYVEQCLGVRPLAGGRHPRMGTHNLLLRLGEAMFLEVIAVDPLAEPPARARWFELDTVERNTPPRLACWVARCAGIEAAVAAAAEPLGRVQAMTRGSLEWLISIPDDGSLPMGGVAPALIEWQTATHPAAGMPDLGCSLVSFELQHPQPHRVASLLASIALEEPAVALSVSGASSPGLRAWVQTPQGVRAIGG